MEATRPAQRLLLYAQRLARLVSSPEILSASCRELLVLTGATHGFISCSIPGRAWESGLHLDAEGEPVAAATRSALFAVHRRVLAHGMSVMTIARDASSETIFGALGCAPTVTMLHVLPLIYRTQRVWGEFVLFGAGVESVDVDGAYEVAQLAGVALESAQRLEISRRDQDRLLLLAEATNDALYDWNFDTRDFWWGGGILKLFGSDADPVEHSSRWRLSRIHPDDRDRVVTSFEAARIARDMTWACEYRFERNDGSYVEVEDRGYFLRDIGGRAYRVMGSLHDVSAIKALLAREQQARADAERASRAKDEFLAMLGHELRNPLAPIVTGLELLRMRGIAGHDKELSILQRQAEHLIHLVDDLLDISRIAHGKIQLDLEAIEIHSVVAAALESTSARIESRRHRVDVDVPARGLTVHGDLARLTQALSNLLNNAAKYTEPGGTISIRAVRDGDSIKLSVRDTGIGIDPATLPHIFNMFVQERQALDRSRGGLGLGLAIVQSLVQQHGGRVHAMSAGRGQGSELTIELPALPGTAASVAAHSAGAGVELPNGRKVIVVDDNEDAADLLSLVLEGLGNTTRIAHDATSALDAIADFEPDLAVLDIGLPEIDGYELARRLRANPRTRPVRLIALTGYGQESDKQRATSAGFDAHLVKPVQLEALQRIIETLSPRPPRV